jgi:hypothetical protein
VVEIVPVGAMPQLCKKLGLFADDAAPSHKTALLKTYWDVPDRQMEVSVVLASPPVDET